MKQELKKTIKEVACLQDSRIAVVLLEQALMLSLEKRDRMFTGVDIWHPNKADDDDEQLTSVLNCYKNIDTNGPPHTPKGDKT